MSPSPPRTPINTYAKNANKRLKVRYSHGLRSLQKCGDIEGSTEGAQRQGLELSRMLGPFVEDKIVRAAELHTPWRKEDSITDAGLLDGAELVQRQKKAVPGYEFKSFLLYTAR